MEQILDELEVKLERFTQYAKVIMWLSIISIFNPPLFFIVLILFLIYNNRFSKLKHIQYFGDILSGLKSKKTKELKSINWDGELLKQKVATWLLAHKYMIKALIVVGIIIAVILGVLGIFYLLGYDMA